MKRTNVRSTIAFRLIVALVALAAIGVSTAVIALWIFNRYGGAAEEIASIEMRRLAGIARFAEIATGARAEMPRLVFAESEHDRSAARARLDAHSQALVVLVGALDLPETSTGGHKSSELAGSLAGDIEAIDANVRERIALRARLKAQTERLHALHDEFQREVEPLLVDAAFNIRVALRSFEERERLPDAATFSAVRQEIAASRALSELHAQVNLVMGKLLQAAAETRRGEIERIRLAVEEAVEAAGGFETTLRDVPSAVTLRQIWHDISGAAAGDGRLLAGKLREASLMEEGAALIGKADRRLEELGDLVGRAVVESAERSVEAARRAHDSISRGTMFILAFSAATAALSFLVGWVYVGRRFIPRLSAILVAMRGIAAGALDTPVKVSGRDEMGLLADALRVLKRRSQLARRRHRELAEANSRLSYQIGVRRVAQRKLEDAQEELVQAGKLAAIGQLSAGVAHEFNQPLAAMRSYAHNARRYLAGGNAEKVGEKLEQIENLIGRLARISGHLKTLARRHPKTVEACDVDVVIERAAALFEMRIAASGTRLVLPELAGLPQVKAEPNRLEQVFINLLSNAFDAVEGRDGAQVAVGIEAGAEGTLRITVADNGPGLPEAQAAHLFDPFFTTKPPGKGLGLGLTIAFNIVQDFGGRLTIEPRPEGGALAAVTLALANAVAQQPSECVGVQGGEERHA